MTNPHGEIRSIEQRGTPTPAASLVRLQRALQALEPGEYAYWAARVAAIVIDNYNLLAPEHKGEEIKSVDMVELRRLMRMLWGDEQQEWLLEKDISPDSKMYGPQLATRPKREMSEARIVELMTLQR